MNQKKVIIIGIALIMLVVILTGVAAAVLMQPEKDMYTVYLRDGYRYLQAGDYDNAILQFRLAMEMDKTREDAYVGLYQSYLHSGQWDYAEITLQIGIRETGSLQLQNLVSQLQELDAQFHGDQTDDPAQNPAEPEKEIEPAMNAQLLRYVASANYGDYCAQYGYEAQPASNGRFTRHIQELGVTLVYYDANNNRVIDTSKGTPYNQYLPNEIYLDNITAAFGGARRITVKDLQQMAGISNVQQDGTVITFHSSECKIEVICQEEGVITDGCSNKITPLKTEYNEIMNFELSAVICDATSNAPISDVRVRIYEGSGAYGDYVESYTDSLGQVVAALKNSGVYTLVAEKDGYITEEFEVIVLSGVSVTEQTFHLSPVMSGEGIRFVLTWGAVPADLDSHLLGTTGDGRSIHVSFADSVAFDGNGNTIADLDVDDISGYGPETTTLYDTNGRFEFIVDDYTDSGMMFSSNAVVKIYVGSTLYTTVNMPTDIEDEWHVCTIVDGEITVTNRPY